MNIRLSPTKNIFQVPIKDNKMISQADEYILEDEVDE